MPAGGVAIWIREDLGFTRIKSPFMEKEVETIAIQIPSHNLIIINVYQGFGDVAKAVGALSDLIDGLVETHKKSDIMMIGDFNVDLGSVTSKSELLIQDMAARNLNQLISMPTRVTTSTIINHVYLKSTKTPNTMTIILDISDHYIIAAVFPHRAKSVKAKTKVTKRWFNDTSFEQLRLLLSSESWEELLLMNLDECTNHLINRINLYKDLVCPIETKPINNWVDPGN